MKIILDTNILVSAFVFGGQAKSYLEIIFSDRGNVRLVSNETIEELKKTLFHEKFQKYQSSSKLKPLFDFYVKSSLNITISKRFDICRDPKDNIFLNLAFNGEADFLITGDQDLLTLNSFYNTRIVTISDFDKVLVGQSRENP